jgi:hypothetical protein
MKIPLTVIEVQDANYDENFILSQSTPSWLESAGVWLTESVIRAPGTSSIRHGELERAHEQKEVDRVLGDDDWSKGSIFHKMRDERFAKSPTLSKEDWEASPYFREHLKYVPNMTALEASILAERKDAELARQDIISRTPDTMFNTVSRFGVDLMGQMIDPLNVAASFVPVVGQARYALMTQKVGKWPARFIAGAIEGTVGAAMVEPLIYASSAREQADYGALDSLMAVGFGGAFGIATHVGGGALGDVLSRGKRKALTDLAEETKDKYNARKQEVEKALGIDDVSTPAKDTMMKSAVAQLASDEPVRVDGIIEADRIARSVDREPNPVHVDKAESEKYNLFDEDGLEITDARLRAETIWETDAIQFFKNIASPEKMDEVFEQLKPMFEEAGFTVREITTLKHAFKKEKMSAVLIKDFYNLLQKRNIKPKGYDFNIEGMTNKEIKAKFEKEGKELVQILKASLTNEYSTKMSDDIYIKQVEKVDKFDARAELEFVRTKEEGVAAQKALFEREKKRLTRKEQERLIQEKNTLKKDFSDEAIGLPSVETMKKQLDNMAKRGILTVDEYEGFVNRINKEAIDMRAYTDMVTTATTCLMQTKF